MSIRKQKRELTRWETATRQWAAQDGRRLTIDLTADTKCRYDPCARRPRPLGIAEASRCGARYPPDAPKTPPYSLRRAIRGVATRHPSHVSPTGSSPATASPAGSTPTRSAGGSGRVVGVKVDLSPGNEFVQLDLPSISPGPLVRPGCGPACGRRRLPPPWPCRPSRPSGARPLRVPPEEGRRQAGSLAELETGAEPVAIRGAGNEPAAGRGRR